ncbi:MAG: Gfo/Idh/MocA family oxidoreductase [Patescibacteria group bacterium]|nr:Gfo/Idh/MocA family oxidoreductase [Patescibacteria group bacterium]
MVLKIGIVGCGVIGARRAKIIQSSNDAKVIAVADTDISKAKSLGSQLDCKYYDNWKDIISNKEMDAVIVSTTNNHLAEISYEAALNGKHVFCEKPLGTHIEEVKKAVEEAKKRNLVFKTGFTLRFHPGMQEVRSVIDKGLIGRILFMRCRYGITGRPEYEKEWRAFPEISGGGELIDQGVHVIDLFRWFLGDFAKVCGSVSTMYWDMKVEDNAFAILTTQSNQIASMHVSWSQWNNLFSFEIFGNEGYVTMEGLGGVYGKETVIVGKKASPNKWPPEEKVMIFDKPETCWQKEWEEFVNAVKKRSIPSGSGEDGLEALKLVFKIYDYAKNQSSP